MEKRLRRIEILIVIILTLVIVNFGYSIIRNSNNSKIDNKELTQTKDLPIDVSRDYLNKIVYKVKNDYNNSDCSELHNTFGDYAKSQISVDDVSDGFKKLKSATKNISTYSYSHYNYKGNSENAEWFEVFYKCKFENGRGTIKLSTRTVDNKTEIVGVVINLDEL